MNGKPVGKAAHRAVRRARLARKIPPGSTCEVCGCPVEPALYRRKGRILCYEHLANKDGRSITELDHLFTEDLAPDAVVETPGNMHREIEELRYDWPEVVRTRGADDPLLRALAMALSEYDRARVVVRYRRAEIDFLFRHHLALVAQHGERWWEALGVGPFWPKAES